MSSMYTLTAMTGREASASRTVVIGTIEFNWRVWMILIWTSPIALIVTGALWPFLGQISLLALPAVEAAALWLIHRRTRDGLRLRTYQAMWDKQKANLDQFFLCGHPISVNDADHRMVVANQVAYVAPAKAPGTAVVASTATSQRATDTARTRRTARQSTTAATPAVPERRQPVARAFPDTFPTAAPTAGHREAAPAGHRLDPALIGIETPTDLVDVTTVIDDTTASSRSLGRTKDAL